MLFRSRPLPPRLRPASRCSRLLSRRAEALRLRKEQSNFRGAFFSCRQVVTTRNSRQYHAVQVTGGKSEQIPLFSPRWPGGHVARRAIAAPAGDDSRQYSRTHRLYLADSGRPRGTVTKDAAQRGYAVTAIIFSSDIFYFFPFFLESVRVI